MDKGYSIYAIIRQSNSNQLRLIEKRACLNRTLSLNDYKQYHDYAVDLYRSYCSCIPWNTGINRIDQLTLGERDAREKAFAFEDTLSQMKMTMMSWLIRIVRVVSNLLYGTLMMI